MCTSQTESEQSHTNERFSNFDFAPRDRSVSESEISVNVNSEVNSEQTVEGDRERRREDASPIWCMDCQDNLIVVGCGSGHLEVWEASSGRQLVICVTFYIACN